jgi:DNA invertase Pin-like site-specific DNA recombinase
MDKREDHTGDCAATPPLRAAQYVRMSAEHQQYSIHNQIEAIARYAANRGFDVVRTYADEGRSGLSLVGRPALQKLLADVASGAPGYNAILVYDVSRLGRFQDPDEAASYELRCRRAGIAVHYCAEQFENDGSIGASIIKTVKRAMAGEYSRELSVKVFAGQANLVRLGFRQGGVAGYGLRRLIVDQNGQVKGELARGEEKNIATDRVILGHGPPEQVAVVREIYRLFVYDGLSEREIARLLNDRGVPGDLGDEWSQGRVRRLLINEKYIGNNVWARVSAKLKQPSVPNAPTDWVRADGAFEPIVDRATYDRAQEILAERALGVSDEAMLDLLRKILAERGMLSGMIIDEYDGAPSRSTYNKRFGGLLRAYTLVGFTPSKDYRFLEANQTLRDVHRDIVAGVLGGIRSVGGAVVQDAGTGLLTINDEFTASLVIARCLPTPAGSLRWTIRLETPLKPDLTVAIRMDAGNDRPLDFYLLPLLDMRQAALRLAEFNGLSLDAYRFETLDGFYDLARRRAWPCAA